MHTHLHTHTHTQTHTRAHIHKHTLMHTHTHKMINAGMFLLTFDLTYITKCIKLTYNFADYPPNIATGKDVT